MLPRHKTIIPLARML